MSTTAMATRWSSLSTRRAAAISQPKNSAAGGGHGVSHGLSPAGRSDPGLQKTTTKLIKLVNISYQATTAATTPTPTPAPAPAPAPTPTPTPTPTRTPTPTPTPTPTTTTTTTTTSTTTATTIVRLLVY